MTSYERTGWRDKELSERHREWGFNCPSVDLDFLMVEYNLGKPIAIVEYKRYTAKMPNTKHPTYRAIEELSDMAGIPFIIAFYWPDIWAFKVYPINKISLSFYKNGQELTEKEFVQSLYYLRSLKIDECVLRNLKNIKPITITLKKRILDLISCNGITFRGCKDGIPTISEKELIIKLIKDSRDICDDDKVDEVILKTISECCKKN